MAEPESDTCRQKAKISKLAIASLLIGILGLLALPFKAVVYLPRWTELSGAEIVGLPGIAGLILGGISLGRIVRSGGALKSRSLAILAIVATGLTFHVWLLDRTAPARQTASRNPCTSNLNRLAIAVIKYGAEHGELPEPNRWCDLLLDSGRVGVERFCCPTFELRRPFEFTWPRSKKGRCYFALNPQCRLGSLAGTVLLFETREGWNQFGGPEILSTDRRNGRGCLVSDNEAAVRFVRTRRLGSLKWKYQDSQAAGKMSPRRPSDQDELKYWLQNMYWFHRFTDEEMAVATGLTDTEIRMALKRFDIWADNRPERQKDASLLVLPYPGGRHPRIGFLEGAIDPQRETKFSVFTPWDPKSYVVVDLPEAIWSNLGLTYLAHTHIDTIWTKQGIELAKLEWNRHPGGRLDIERELPNGIVFGAKVEPRRESVRMEMWLKNGTKRKLSDLRIQICVMPKMATGFAEQTNENKVFRDPYAACRSSDGKRWVITAWENCHRPWGNARCPCFHSDPKFPDLEPGRMHRLRGWLSFYEGTDIEAELERIEQTGWHSTIQ